MADAGFGGPVILDNSVWADCSAVVFLQAWCGGETGTGRR